VNQTQHVENGTTAVITCNIASLSDYPEWRGPPVTDGGLKLYNIIGDSNFFKSLVNRDRLSWGVNKKDLVLSNVVRGDEGKYFCSDYSTIVNHWTVQLNIRGRILWQINRQKI